MIRARLKNRPHVSDGYFSVSLRQKKLDVALLRLRFFFLDKRKKYPVMPHSLIF
ncbi:MAG: hypothetical protein IKN43_07105 [Selenomonadaceae bacterium]|nr:hypothetical protein [Selenomonadaceae bacterium]